MTSEEEKQLKLDAVKVREGVLISVHGGHSGHPGGSLSAADMLTYLYGKQMRIHHEDPRDPNRDRFVLSKGHCTPAYYSVLALHDYFPFEDLPNFRHFDSYLQGHPNMRMVPGVDMSTGSLGQGFSVACGMALGAKLSNRDYNVYVLLGDGEIEEGQNWEAAMFAHQYGLDNLCAIVDVNGLQIDGSTKDVMDSSPLDDKFKAFGENVITINGHDFKDIERAFQFFENNKGSGHPTVILMKTIKGKGVSYMENQAGWHGKAPNDEQFAQGMKELDAARKQILAEYEGGGDSI